MKKTLVIIILFWYLGGANVIAQQENLSPAPVDMAITSTEVMTIKEIKTLITKIKGKMELDEAFRAKLIKQYRAALYQLALSQQHNNEAEDLRQNYKNDPEETRRIREKLEKAKTSDIPEQVLPSDLPEHQTSRELEQQAAKKQTDLANLKGKLTNIEENIQTLLVRPDTIQQELITAKKKLEEIENSLKESPFKDENPLEANARITLLKARRSAQFNEVSKLEQEQLGLDVRRGLLLVTREAISLEISRIETEVEALEGLANKIRQEEAKQAQLMAETAKRKAIGKHPIIQGLAEENSNLSSELANVTEQISKVIPQRESLSNNLKQFGLDYENAKKQIKIAGRRDEALVEILLDQRRRLPDLRQNQKNNREIEAEIISIRLSRFKLDEQIRTLSNIREETLRIIHEKIQDTLPGKSREDIESEIAKLLTRKSELLNQLDTAYGNLLKALGQLYFEQKQYISEVEDYASFMNEQLMWVPGSSPLGMKTWYKLTSSLNWFFSPQNWKELGISCLRIIKSSPILAGITFIVTLGLCIFRIKLKNKLESTSKIVKKISTDHYKYTMHALLITILLVIPFPLLIGFVSWQLLSMEGVIEFVKAFGYGLSFVSFFVLSLQFFKKLCHPHGLGKTHFRWKDVTLAILRHNISWLVLIVSIAGFFSTMIEWQDNDNYRDSLGRLAFITGMIAFAVFIQRVSRPREGVFQSIILEKPNGWLSRLEWIWYPSAIILPLLLAGISVFGYYYEAFQLGLRLLQTLWLIIGATIIYHFGIRWFHVRERKLALEQALERRKAAEKISKEKPQETPEAGLPLFEEPEVDISTVKEQTRNLLKSFIGMSVVIGIWMIWSTILPALNILNNIKLWSYTVEVSGESTQQWVTLLHIIFCLIVGIITTVTAKNLPGVLEIILQNLPFQPGSRYAITSISQYILATIGIIVIFNILGVNWSRLGWILTALSVGLGFGLQEVVANFVCGILLFVERPIRIGDIVTISDVTGVISKIRIRATTITNWDQQEYVVPNKEFITGRILNWTLSNNTNRIIVNVGVAYGSDVEHARNLLLQIAKEHPEILDDPPPLAIFEKFDDSTLNISLRCYLPNMDKRLTVKNDLHTAIHSRFNKAGIEIAFPQRDIHMKTIYPSPEMRHDYIHKESQNGNEDLDA